MVQGEMIEIRGYNGTRHYVKTTAIARLTEAGPSSQWHGIRCIVKCFDGVTIEAGDTIDAIELAIRKAQGG